MANHGHMLNKALLIIHWICFVMVIILVSKIITGIIIATLINEEFYVVTPSVVDEAALAIINYFVILPIYTIFYWLLNRQWVFFPWQHK